MTPPVRHSPVFMSIQEIADITGVSKMTIYREVRRGELKAIQVGRSWRVPRSEFARYLRDGAVPLGSDE